MNKSLKKTIKVLVISLLIPILIFGGYLLFMIVTDFKPQGATPVAIQNNKTALIKKDSEISIITYNIGYGGLDKFQDFFMDGGTGSRSSSKEKTLENTEGVRKFIEGKNPDIVIFQEVDRKSTRSCFVNQVEYLSDRLNGYSSTFAVNYKVPWVFVPLNKPHGTVNSGLLTLSKYQISSAMRYQYPGSESYLRQLFDLDRCFLETRLPVEGGGELILLNSHLSAYDKGGKVRKQQLTFLKNYIKNEYDKGNYVIVGGDWNHALPGTDPLSFKTEQTYPDWLQKMPEDFAPEDFKWAADGKVPSNRTVDIPYKEGVNFLSVIDGYLVSPNVEINLVEGYSLGFQYTDHNPVLVELILK
jgi:endonuclease/exonuclease/phosphatase family metal-dependent hydrolase